MGPDVRSRSILMYFLDIFFEIFSWHTQEIIEMQRDNIDAVRRNVDGACTGCSGGRLRFLVVIRTV